MVVEVDDAIRKERVQEWIAYGRSCGRDFRCSVCLPSNRLAAEDDQRWLAAHGIGLYLTDGTLLTERIQARDLAMNVELPNRDTLIPAVLQIVGRIYEKVERRELNEAFEEACKVLEREARRHLAAGIRSTRIRILDAKGRDRTPLPRAVDRYTLGQLAKAFRRIHSQTAIDSRLQGVLEQVNPDRVGVTHHRERAEARIRRNAGRHLWAIVGAVKLLHR